MALRYLMRGQSISLDTMRKMRLLILLFLSTSAHAGPYVELGIGSADGCIKTGKECSERPLGIAAVGFEHKGFSASVEHISSLRDGQDYGLNLKV